MNLLSTYCVPICKLESGYTVVNNTDHLCPNKASILVGKEDATQTAKKMITNSDK